MTRLHFGVAVLSVALLGAVYQEKNKESRSEDPPAKLKGQLPPYFKKVGLSEEQIQKIYKIRADYKIKMDELKKKLEQTKAEEKELMEKVLTPTQLKKLRELRSGEKPSDK